MTNEENRQFVMSYMAPANRHKLTDIHFTSVWLVGNGFGDYPGYKMGADQDWDHSHVRDSNPEGVDRMATELRKLGYVPDSERPVPAHLVYIPLRPTSEVGDQSMVSQDGSHRILETTGDYRDAEPEDERRYIDAESRKDVWLQLDVQVRYLGPAPMDTDDANVVDQRQR